MSVEKVKNMLPFTVAEEKSPTLQTLLGLCLQETTLISLLIWYSTFYRVLPVNSFYRWFLPVNRWCGKFSKFTTLDVSSRISCRTKRTNPIWFCIWFGDTKFAITVEPACMVHGCKVNPLVWSIFDWSQS